MTDFRFTTSIETRYADLDAQGHLNNAKYFTFMEHGRLKYCVAVGLLNPADGFMGQGQIVAEATCAFKRPVQLGQWVAVAVRIASIGDKSAVMEYRLTVAADVVATGRTVQVAYDYDLGRSMSFPAEWRAKVAAFEAKN